MKFVLRTSEVKFAHHFAVRRNFTHKVNFTIEDNFTCREGKLSVSVFSVKDNTHRDKSLAGFSIYACGVRYVLTHSISRDLSHIELAQSDNISSLSVAKAYRVNEVDISTKEKTRANTQG